VTICHRLGIGSLWIDSLCIVQDDEQDWMSESWKMGSIYQNGYLTIAAAGAGNDMEGCFVKKVKDEDMYAPHLISLPPNDQLDEIVAIYVRRRLPHLPWSKSEVAEWPLMQRGWAFQERLLSRRLLHFGPHEVVWKCEEASYCECGSISANKSLINATKKNLDVAATWRKAVMEYSGKSLTYDKDRLPAIEGVARDMQRRCAEKEVLERYLAGLWSEDLPLGLLWHTRYDILSGEVQKRRPDAYRAPSWSWTSVEGGVDFIAETTYAGREIVPEVQILGSECTAVGEGTFGPFLDGRLLLREKMIRSDLLYRPRPVGQGMFGPEDVDVYGFMLNEGGRPIWVRPDVDDLACISTSQDDVDMKEEKGWRNLGPVYAITLASMGLHDGDTRSYSMVLKAKKDGESIVFERIDFGFQNYPSDTPTTSWFWGVEQSVVEVH
jgi:hypothetical protein